MSALCLTLKNIRPLTIHNDPLRQCIIIHIYQRRKLKQLALDYQLVSSRAGMSPVRFVALLGK